MPFRVAVVNSHPIQYFAPLYAYLNRDPAFEVTVFYCSDSSLRAGFDLGFGRKVTWDVDLLAGYDFKWLGKRAKKRTPRGFWSLVCPEVWSAIRDGRFDTVWLHGYGYAAYVLAFLAAKSRHIPVVVRSETHLGLKRNAFRRWVRDSILSFAYQFVDGFLAIGSANRDYYRSLGVAEQKIFDVPYTVDNERFISASRMSDEERREVRRRYGLPEEWPLVLFASKLMPRKHPDDLVRAIHLLQQRGVLASLLLVGTGEAEQQLRAVCAEIGIAQVAFGGFVNQSDLPRVLGASDIFVLPSENEPWGLIVNEAMCASLPIVVGQGVGCAEDLLQEGVNGYTHKVGDICQLADILEELVSDANLRKRMGAASLTIIRSWDYARCVEGLRGFREAEYGRMSPGSGASHDP